MAVFRDPSVLLIFVALAALWLACEIADTGARARQDYTINSLESLEAEATNPTAQERE